MPAAAPAYSLDTLSGEAAAPPYAGNQPAQVARQAAVRLAAVAPPGPWTSDRYAQVNHYTGLVYCAAKAKRDALVAATVTATKLRPRKRFKAVSSPRPHTHDEDRVPVPEGHPLSELFADPNDQDTVGDLLGDLVVQQDLHGVALLWHPLNAKGRPAQLFVLPASAVQYIPPSGLYPQGGYNVTFAGTYTPLAVPGAGWSVSLDKREVLEIRDRHPRVWYGTWGPLDAGAEWVDLARGIDISQKRAFDHGFSPDVVLSIDGATSDVIDAVEAQIKARYEGRDGRKVLVADGTGIKAEKLNTTPREMDYASSKDMATKQVLALFGVNSTVAGLTDADSYASLYAKLRQFYGGTMANLCQRWSAAFTKHLARRFYGAEYAVEVTVPTPDDPDRLDKQRDSAAQVGGLTVNEYRGQLDLDPWPDGDVPFFEFQAKRQQAFAPPPPVGMPGVAPQAAPVPDNPAGEGSLPNRLKAMPVEYSDPAPYGYCPECRTPGVLAERRPNGDAQCGNGHRYPRAKAKYASTQIDLTGPPAARLRALAAAIPDADLADDGRGSDPHVTVRYGLHADAPGPVAAAVAGFGSVRLRLAGLSAFRGKEYDVIYAAVDSPDLLRLNATLAALPHTDTHSTYVPHATVAYVKPGLADKYLTSLGWLDVGVTADRLTFSTAAREHSVVPLTARKAMSACLDGSGGELVPPAVSRKRVKLKRAKRYAARVVKSLGLTEATHAG